MSIDTRNHVFAVVGQIETCIEALLHADPALLDAVVFGKGRYQPDAHGMIDALVYELWKVQVRLHRHRASKFNEVSQMTEV